MEENERTDNSGNPQQSIVHVTLNHPIQVVTAGGLSESEELEEERRRREVLARRPSYRKILHEIAGDDQLKGDHHDEDSNSGLSDTGSETNLQQPVIPAHIQLVSDTSGVQTITMTNSTSPTPNGSTIVQYAQSPEGQQYFIPVSVAGTPGQTYQLTTANSLQSSPNVTEEASRKRELRLLKNREAARECRRKKKEYVKCLENRVAVLENQNKALIEELKNLKELYCSKDDVA
ncbi:unnamed protein product [Dimorphilus gyrociliatus]|uniref:Uncharacterized protein n=1 Tax=Dimorphilus gyrociliatus TaxID=2664684 RepID=A0A7I8VNE8_9ANNE|nr:unnamed protein product [Dimorphilus gyrociliatus]